MTIRALLTCCFLLVGAAPLMAQAPTLAGPPPEPIVGEVLPYATPGPALAVPPGTALGERPIRYVHHCKLFPSRGGAPVETVMLVKDPLSCDCVVPISVCVPACPEEPLCFSRIGLLGRGNVTYLFSNGVRLKIVFEKTGEVTVHTFT